MATIMLKLEKKFPTHIGFTEVICRNTDTRAMLVFYTNVRVHHMPANTIPHDNKAPVCKPTA